MAGTAVRVIGVILCVILGLTLAPAASASFTATRQASTGFSTAVLPTLTETSFPVSNVCAKGTGYYDVSISVPDVVPAVQYANYLELQVLSPDGNLSIYDLSKPPSQRKYALTIANNLGKGRTWTYTIIAAYKVPGSSNNVWTANVPLIGSVTCV